MPFMKGMQSLKVKDVARLTGVSVRTLHYYDEIGILVAERSRSGYRLYTERDLLRLQQILLGRSVGLPLEDIKRSLDDPAFDHADSLRRQRALLVERLAETHRVIASIDAALARIAQPTKESIMDLKSIFDGFDLAEYEEEANARWGHTDAYKESVRRTQRYGETEWRAIKEEAAAIWQAAAEAMAAGATPESDAAIEIVQRHRLHIGRWFYPLSPAMHAKLADMWESDQRFVDNIDRYGAGLTPWIAGAVRAASKAS
jgi:DNA-binding transcriptional MerR regulator